MPCVNHPDQPVQAYCQNCGKALCSACVRTSPSGQILCDPCLATAASNPAGGQQFWPGGQPYVPPPPGTPNPAAAAVLGLIPGVGAMYNGQLFKGLIHVVIFAVLVSITDHYAVFGLFIAAWVLYQSFEAFHTAKARRDGLPVPDPFGLNELGGWLNLGGSNRGPGHPPQGVPGPGAPPASGPGPIPGQPADPAPGGVYPPYSAPYTGEPYAGAPYSEVPGAGWTGNYPPQPPYVDPYSGQYPPPGAIPPVPPPPGGWRRSQPVWAFVLIGLGILFLLQSLDIVGHVFHYAWPVLLIGLGIWLIISRTQGGSK